jgi:nucleoside-diphosphate-sugar epimerase
MTNVVITGGAGYIGSAILQANRGASGVSIRVFDNLFWNQGPLVYPMLRKREGYAFHRQDVLEWRDSLKRAIASADIIVPLAALVGAPLCDKHPELAYKLNYEWFEQLLNYINGKQLIVYPNTNSGYGSTGKEICTEETPSNPISLYGKTKQSAEDLLMSSYDNCIGFRLATVFGWSYRPRLDLLVNNLTMTALKEGHIDLFDGHFRRNYIHVQDISDAVAFAFRHRIHMKGEIYNLGNDEINMTKESLVKNICEITGATYKTVHGKTDPDKRDYIVSSQKLYNLGFKPKRDLEHGIREIMEFSAIIPDLENSSYHLKNY